MPNHQKLGMCSLRMQSIGHDVLDLIRWGSRVGKNWYVLAVQPRKERYVADQLRALGHHGLYPRYLKTIRHARRVKNVASPLFPGYLFVQLSDASEVWRQINSLPGSIGLIKFNSRPAPLHKDFANSVIYNMDPEGLVSFSENLNIGDEVRAVGGPFDQLLGKIVELPDRDRITILIKFLNRDVEVTLRKSAVVAAA